MGAKLPYLNATKDSLKTLHRKILKSWVTKIFSKTSDDKIILVTSGTQSVSPPSPLNYTCWFVLVTPENLVSL